jgi:ribosomal-protein-alanine N-acetyltransferase
MKLTSVKIRPQKVSDAKAFYEILKSPKFKYFPSKPKSIEEERKFLRDKARKKKKTSYDYSIVYKNRVVGGAGIKLDSHGHHIMELGGFVDETYWNKGIMTYIIKVLEKIAKKKGAVRLELRMMPQNKASVRIANKCGYKKEGLFKKAGTLRNKYTDLYVFSKIIK